MFEVIGSVLISAGNPDLVSCTTFQPGEPKQEHMVSWYQDGEHKLDVPHWWNEWRTYAELEDWGFCNSGMNASERAKVIFGHAVRKAPDPVVPSEPSLPVQVSDDLLKRAIGRAEGTRGKDGTTNQNYHGHKDPGWSGRCRNQGSFSYQHCAPSPEEADRRWIVELRKAEGRIQNAAIEKFGQPLSKAAIVSALDGYTQSPNAGGKFVKHLDTADPTPQQIINARTAALNESRRERGGPPMNVPADQKRRVDALMEQVQLLN